MVHLHAGAAGAKPDIDLRFSSESGSVNDMVRFNEISVDRRKKYLRRSKASREERHVTCVDGKALCTAR